VKRKYPSLSLPQIEPWLSSPQPSRYTGYPGSQSGMNDFILLQEEEKL